jgi:hypothetical protein
MKYEVRFMKYVLETNFEFPMLSKDLTTTVDLSTTVD